MRKFTFIVLVLLAFSWQSYSQSIVIGTGTDETTSTESDPIHGYYNAFRYQVVYTAAELSASLTPYDEITALGWSISGDYAGGNLLGYTIKMGHTSAANSASHDNSSTIVVKNAFDYDPTVTAAGVFDMITFDTNFVWNGVDNVLVEVCSDGQNPFSGPYGQVRGTDGTNNSRIYRVDGSSACGVDTSTTNPHKPNIQFNYIDGTPPACFAPTAITVDSFTATTAEISWTAGQGELDWEIVVQAAGTGTPGAADNSGTDTGTNPHSATGLTAQTAYEVYVRADCSAGAGTDFSAWSGPVNFTTACAIETAPYTEDFENGGALPDCWTLAGDDDWEFANSGSGEHIGDNGTLSGSTDSNGYFAWVDDSTPDATNAELRSPLVDLSGLTTPSLSFYEISDNEGANPNATLTVDVWDGAAWNTVGTYNTNTSGWEQKFIDLSGLTFTGPAQARFLIADSGSFYDDIAIDDVSFDEYPSCFVPSGLAIDSFNASSATISWTAGVSGESDWEIVVQTDGTGTPVGSGVATSSSPYFALSLAPSTDYEVYLRANCGGGDFSDWIGPVDFTTLPSTVPSCSATYTPAPDASCGNSDTTLSWDAADTADGYRITVGTTSGGNDILDDVDLGDVLTTTVSSQSPSTTYYYTVSPYNIVGTNTTCTEQTYTTNATACLCDSVPTSNDGAGISNVRIGFDDYATGDVTYFDHSGPVNELSQGVPINVQITFETGYTYGTHIWIDLNDNGDLTDPGELVFSGESLADNPTTLDASFTVPSGFLGAHKMRIGTADSGQATPNPCYSGTYGVTLDFDVNITAPSCTPAVIASTTVVDNCATGQYNVEVDVTDPGTATFLIGTAPVPITSGINVVGPFDIGTTSPSINVIDVTNSACNIDLGTFDSDGHPPSDLVASNITGTTADLAWTVNGSETAWEVLVLPAGDPAPLGTTSGTDVSGANPYTATGLTAQTSYDAYVRGMCGTDPEWVGPETFTTPCPVFTPSYSEDFTTFLDQCWEEATDGDLIAGPASFGSGGFLAEEFAHVGTGNGAVNINLYLGGPDIDWLLSPSFDLSADGYQLEVDVALTNYNSTAQGNFNTGDQVLIVYSNDGTNWTTLVTYDDTNEPAAAGQTEIVDLTGITGTSVQFAFYVSEGTTGRDIDFHIDNFKVRTPPTCFDVSGLSLDSVSTTTADISWTNAGAETNWEIAVQAAGTGVPSTANDSGANTATNPYTATGLTAQTDYEVYVRAECTLGSEFGEWVGPLNFSTTCNPLSTFPWTEDFESITTPDLPICWSALNENADGDAFQTYGTYGAGGSNAAGLYTDFNGGSNDDYLILPQFTLTGNQELTFSVRARSSGEPNDYRVVLSTTGTAAADFSTELRALTEVSNTTHETIAPIRLTAYTGDVYIAIHVPDGGLDGYYIYFDDFSIVDLPPCVDPTDIAITPAATTADISWTPGTDETAWEVVVQAPLTGEPAGAGTAATNPYTATGLTSETAYEVYIRSNCGVDGFSVWTGPFNFTTTPDCPAVTAITLDDVTTTTADVSWTAGNAETNWEVVIQAPGTGLPAAADGTGTDTTSNPYSFTGLTANTAYEVYVRAECTAGTEFSTWNGPFNFTTPCETISAFPWTEDFESITIPNLPDCWTELNENADGDFFRTWNDFSSVSNEAGLYTDFNAGNNDDYLILPPFTLTGNERFKFSVRARSTGEPNDYRVVLSTTGTAAADFSTELQALTSVSNTTHAEIAPIDLSAYSGDVYLAIHVPSGGLDGYYIYFDDFTVEEIPSCLDVTSITVSGATGTSANIGWTENGTATDWEVAVQPDGTGTPASGDATTSNPYSATGLTPETDYEIYVRANCGGAGFSAWTGPVTFTTPCATETPDYTEDFTTFLNSCWTEATDGDLTSGPANFGSGGFLAEEFAHVGSGNGAVNINMYLGGPDIDWLLSPSFDLSADGYELLVDVAMTDYNATTQNDGFSTGDEVHIVYSNDGTNWTDLVVYNDVNVPAAAGQTETIDLSGITGTNVRFAFYVSEGTDDGRDIDFHIDNFIVRTPPSCPDVSAIAVSNITTTSADIAWTNGGSETAWEVAVQAAGTGEPGAADGSGTDSATNPYNATGLSSSTSYEVWVRAECTAGVEFGAWIGPINFATACDSFSTFPYTEGFESGVPPTCWSTFRGTNDEGTTYDWTTTATANSGSQAAFVRFSVSGNDAEDWLVTPEFDFSALSNPEFSFFTREGLTTDYGSTLTVRVSTTDTAHASFTTVYTSGETDITTYNQLVIDLSAYAGAPTVYIAIVWANDDGDSLYVDDVAVYDNIPGTYTYTDGVWSPSTPTNDLDDIIIASGNLVLSSDLTCNTMTVNPGASVTVDVGTTLEATNGLTLESSSTSYSSLIPNGTIVGTMEYERHVNINGSGTTGSNDLVSAPLTGQQFDDFAAANPNIFSNGAGTLYLFGPFEKVTGQYVTWANTETATLDAGVGYRAASTDNDTFTFTGNAETG
ncbi:choice-of-anchor J domain-containing protein, partial [Psychroserpens sp. S379A]|uniref:choice-of-anchor J domain-containing protein n=1 Tax=Psychroserpens sp. S379A TaxID=3415137 RepID=UPI003C7C0BF3